MFYTLIINNSRDAFVIVNIVRKEPEKSIEFSLRVLGGRMGVFSESIESHSIGIYVSRRFFTLIDINFTLITKSEIISVGYVCYVKKDQGNVTHIGTVDIDGVSEFLL